MKQSLLLVKQKVWLLCVCLVLIGCSSKLYLANEDGDMGITFSDYEGTWYLESEYDLGEDPRRCVIPIKNVPKSQREYVIRLPQEYTAEIDGLKFTLNFFQQDYQYNELIQIRVTIENQTQSDVEHIYYDMSNCRSSYFENGNSQICERFVFRDYDLWSISDSIVYAPLMPDGHSAVLEYAHYADPEFFVPGQVIEYKFRLYEWAGETNEAPRIYTIDLPVKIVQMDSK